MSNTYYYWLIGFLGLGGAAVAAHLRQSERRFLVTNVYLLFALIFVGIFGFKSFELRKDSNLALTKAELSQTMLKINTSMIAAGKAFPLDAKSHKQLEQNVQATFRGVIAAMEEARDAKQDADTELDAKIVILKAELKESVKENIQDLEKKDADKAGLLKAVLQDKSVSKEAKNKLEKLIDSKIPEGWFREVFDIEWTKALGDKKGHAAKLETFNSRYIMYLGKLLAFFAFLALCFLVGSIVLVSQLFFLGRNSGKENDAINESVRWPWQSTAAVILTWLSMNFLLSPFSKSLSTALYGTGEKSALTLALGTVALYLTQNLPALILVYFLAIRPGGIKLFSSEFSSVFRLKWKTEKRGPFGLVIMGILAWISCFPLVFLSQFVAVKYFGSQMSSNPIISEVVAATKDMNIPAILAFIFSLGVMPALVEEFLFRGFLYSSIRKYLGVFLALILSSSVFSLVHMDQGSMLQLFSLGFVFAYVFEKNHSIIPSMVAHCMWNLTTFTAIVLLYS